MPDRLDNNNQNGNDTQSTPSIERRIKYNSGNADETTVVPTTATGYQKGSLARPMDDTPNCSALSLLQHLDELGMEITINSPAQTLESILLTHNIKAHLNNLTTKQQIQLKEIGVAHVDDLASPEDRNYNSPKILPNHPK